jgi:D-alanyl-D-alanine-carboxypeptidase/D-alanyl-D-alanine-endopeptidase
MKRCYYLLLVAAAVLRGQVPTDAEIRSILSDRIDKVRQNVGIAVGIVDANGRRFVSYGSFSVKDPSPVGNDTVFEIGSTTKVFTSTILADMVQRGEVSLDDPVARYLPADVKMPQRGGKQITLVDLATHTSGLPRMPANFKPKDPDNPYADYTLGNLFEFLSSYELTRDIGSQFEYSNMGAGLLGQALARRAGMDYEALVRARVTGPLKMENTRIALSAEMKSRLAPGHNGARQPTANWDLPTFAGAGALRSDARDMLTFIAAHLGYVESPLGPAMAAMTKVRRPAGGPQTDIALAWIVVKKEGREIFWHNGGTGGYRSFMGYDPKSRVGVVVLSNMSTGAGVDDIGMHLLDSSAPLAKLSPLVTHKEITLDPKIFDRYTGVYQLAPGITLAFTREGTQMFTQLTNQPKLEIFAKGEKEFFLKVVDAQISFETGEDGRATAATLHQNGRDQKAARVEQ